jgi:hypothetical protein
MAKALSLSSTRASLLDSGGASRSVDALAAVSAALAGAVSTALSVALSVAVAATVVGTALALGGAG